MKKAFLLLVVIIFCSCKKQDVQPSTITNTVIVHDTVTIHSTTTDTIYEVPKSDIIQGSWYCYAYSNYGSTSQITVSPSVQINATQSTFDFSGSSTAAYSSDYSTIYLNSGIATNTPAYTVYSSLTELKLLAWNAPQPNPSHGTTYYLRRTP